MDSSQTAQTQRTVSWGTQGARCGSFTPQPTSPRLWDKDWLPLENISQQEKGEPVDWVTCNLVSGKLACLITQVKLVLGTYFNIKSNNMHCPGLVGGRTT